MRDDELRELLRDRNPWWRAAGRPGDPLGWAMSDKTLVEADRLGIDYRPGILSDVVDGGLYVLRGPRRVGKSVVLKRYAYDRLAEGAAPSSVIYLGLDDLDPRALRRALKLGRDLTAPIGDKPRLWLLDEITAVADWPAILKSARDDTPFGFDTVVVSGSSAHDLSEARRALGAGRVGRAVSPFRLLLPMGFREFARLTSRQLPSVPTFGASQLQSDDASKALSALMPFVGELDLAWQAYCETGGFPRAVAEHRRLGIVSQHFCAELLDWLTPDVTPDDAPESVVRLLSQLGTRMASPLNLRNTAEAVRMSAKQLRTRINRMIKSVAAIECPQVDDAGQPVPGSQSKVYLIDPLLARLPALTEAGLPVPDLPKLSESALAIALGRAMEQAHPGRLLEGRAVAYARNQSGREIDFAALPTWHGGVDTWTTPIESKWVSDGWRRDAQPIRGRYGRGVVATKDVLDLSNDVWAIPAGAIALMLA